MHSLYGLLVNQLLPVISDITYQLVYSHAPTNPVRMQTNINDDETYKYRRADQRISFALFLSKENI